MKRTVVFAVCLLLVLLLAFAVPAHAQVDQSTDVGIGGTGCEVSYKGGSVTANIWTGYVSIRLGTVTVDLSGCFHQ
jgi:hypothetical protein